MTERVDIEALRHFLSELSPTTPVPESMQSDIRMAFNEALAGGANMNGDAGSIIHTPGYASDLLFAPEVIWNLRDELEALAGVTAN